MLEKLIDNFLKDYNEDWFNNCSKLYEEHPFHRANKQSIDFFQFTYGARYDEFDEIYDKVQLQNMELERVEISEPPYYVEVPKLPEKYAGAGSLYPILSLATWRDEFMNEIDECLKLLIAHSEKEIFFGYVNKQIEGLIILANRINTGKNSLGDILTEFLRIISEEIDEKSQRVQYLYSIISSHTDKIHFNINQNNLAKLFCLLGMSNMVDSVACQQSYFAEIIAKYCQVMENGKPKQISKSSFKAALNRELLTYKKSDMKIIAKDFVSLFTKEMQR